MRNPAPACAALVMLALGSACSGASPTPAPSPTAPSVIVTSPRSPYPPNSSFTLLGVSLSGTVSEVTSAGLVPLGGANVYCDACGNEGHSSATTDANGGFTFSGDLSKGGGVLVSPGYATYLIVTKDGYQDPTGLPASMYPAPRPDGWREFTVSGHTQFDIQLVRR